jgi:hypothetical protein
LQCEKTVRRIVDGNGAFDEYQLPVPEFSHIQPLPSCGFGFRLTAVHGNDTRWTSTDALFCATLSTLEY